jgi:hypothetical protein
MKKSRENKLIITKMLISSIMMRLKKRLAVNKMIRFNKAFNYIRKCNRSSRLRRKLKNK